MRCKSGPVLCKKLPVNFSKAYLLHINVNILYRRCLFSASAFSISAENPDIFVMTHCRMKAAGSLHAVRSRCRLSAVPFRHFMCPCRMGVIYKKHGFGFILPLFMSIELWAEAFGCGRFIKHVCVHANKKENECPHVPKLAKFKPPRCPIGVYWNTLCLMRDVWTIKTYMI